MKQSNLKAYLGWAGLALVIPVLGYGTPLVFRHVLPCVNDVTPQTGELVADISSNTIKFKSASGVLKTFGNSFSRKFPQITETQQSVTWKTAGVIVELSDGALYQFDSDQTFDRIQFSYGLGGAPQLNAGWVYGFAVPHATQPGKASLQLSNFSSAPAGASRYVGSFYLEENAACVGDECTDGATLPSTCLDYSDPSTCPAGYGRLIGVSLVRDNHLYQYKIKLRYTSSAESYVSVSNAPKFAARVGFFGKNLSIRTYEPEMLSSVFSYGSTWVKNSSIGVSVYDFGDGVGGVLDTAYLIGHEEGEGLYE